MLLGVPDDITDMTRSLEIVERQRLIYRTIVFRHRKCSGGTGYVSGHRKGFRAPPAKIWALLGQERDIPAHKGLVRPHIG